MRVAFAVLLALSVSACATGPHSPPPLTDAQKAEETGMIQHCRATYTTWLTREHCLEQVGLIYQRPGYPYKDLWDAMWAQRALVAAEVDSGHLTPHEGSAAQEKAINDMTVAAMDRMDRRLNAMAIEDAVSAPVSCYNTGYVTTCY